MIEVPEFKQSNTTPDELLLYLYQSSHYITNALAKGISMNNLHEPVGVLLNIGLKFLNISKSIQCLLSVAQDSISCFCLLRTQADYLSSLYLIFEKSKNNPNDCKFRYLLYFLDGFQSRHEVLTEHVKLENNGSITDEEFQKLKKQVEDADKNSLSGIKECKKLLDEHPYKQINAELFYNIVKDKAWKYKSFDSNIKKPNKYTWKELYSLLDSRDSISSFFSYLSQYVHGLLNAIIIEDSPENFYNIKCFEISLLSKYQDLLTTLYGKEIINEKIFYPELRRQINKVLASYKQT